MKRVDGIICYNVISEPGDRTRYDYIIHQNGTVFNIMPKENDFPYPQRLDYYDVIDIETPKQAQIFINGKKSMTGVNPCTLLEVIRTIKEFVKGGK